MGNNKLQAARELETERRRAEALSAEQQAARQQLAALRAEVGALKQQRGQRQEQQQAAAEVRVQPLTPFSASAVDGRALELLQRICQQLLHLMSWTSVCACEHCVSILASHRSIT